MKMLEMSTPEKFTDEKQQQVFLNGTNALDWLEIATAGEYNLDITQAEHRFEHIPWKNPVIEGDEGVLIVLIATAIVSLQIPVISPCVKEGVGCNTTFIEPGSNMTKWSGGSSQKIPRTIVDCNTTVMKSIDTTVKGAETDALKRALRKFGPGADLYPRSETRNGTETNKDAPPVLYLKGINLIKDDMGWSVQDVSKIATSLLGKDIEPQMIGTDPVTQRELYYKLRAYYIQGDMYIPLGED
jgi:hypothetical protein